MQVEFVKDGYLHKRYTDTNRNIAQCFGKHIESIRYRDTLFNFLKFVFRQDYGM